MNKNILIIFMLAATLLCLSACSSKSDKSAGTIEPVEQQSSADAANDATDYHEGLPTVIDFYATWCGPCKQIAPLFDQLKVQYANQLNFVRVDVDADPQQAQKYGIEAMPTFVFLDADGKEVNRIIGADAEGLRQAAKESSAASAATAAL